VNLQLLADENVNAKVVERLRSRRLVVEFIAETAPGSSDEAILGRGDIAELILITYDRDFGELIFKRKSAVPSVLIYSRLGRADPRYVADRIIEILGLPPEVGNCYVITRDGVRVRPFAAGNIIDA